MIFYSSRHISRGGMYFPCFCILEMKYMTLLQRDRENIELGREEGSISATKILKLHNKGMDNEDISSSLQLDLEYVNSVISDYEND